MRDDWKLEMDEMLSSFDKQAIFTLRKIGRHFKLFGRSFDDDFRKYFLEMSQYRLVGCFSMVQMELRLSIGQAKSSKYQALRHSSVQKSPVRDRNIHAQSSVVDGSNLSINRAEKHCQHGNASDTRPNEVETQSAPQINSSVDENEDNLNIVIEISNSDDEEGHDDRIIVELDQEQIDDDIAMRSSEGTAPDGNNTLNAGDVPEMSLDSNSTEYQTPRNSCSQESPCQDRNNYASNSPVDGSDLSINRDENVGNTSDTRSDEVMFTDAHDGSNTGDIPGKSLDSHPIQKAAKRRRERNPQNPSRSNGAKRFKCDQCVYVTARKGDLNRHIKGKHSDDRPYQCDQCTKGFTQLGNLKRHKTTHKDVFPFHCAGCCRGFSQKIDKENHEKECRIRRYECHLCKTFVTVGISKLKLHMLKHTGEKPHRCNRCTKSYTQSNNFRRHMATHKSKKLPFYCIACLRRFLTEKEKQAHERLECTNRRYECHLCKTYVTVKIDNFKNHMQQHTKK